MKKLACLGLCLAAQTALAGPTPFFDGFMIAGSLGATSAQYNLSQNLGFTIPPSSSYSLPDRVNLFGNSPMGQIALGYSYQTNNNFVLAGAFTVGYTDAKVTDQISSELVRAGLDTAILNASTTAQITNDFSVLFKPGYVWGRTTLFYGLIGPRWANMKTTTNMTLSSDDGNHLYTGTGSNSLSAYQLGVTFGLGVQQLLTPRYSWALEYAYTTYGKITSSSTTGVLDRNGSPLPGSSFFTIPGIDATSNTLMFTIAYRI